VIDIVQRLRMIVASGNGGAFEEHLMEAAAEIERLREERPKVRVPLADLSGRVSRDRVIDALKDAGVEVEE
jgi:hypothetical protein